MTNLSDFQLQVLSKCLRPMAGAEFTDRERQAVHGLVQDGLIEDHGERQYYRVRWDLRIFRTGWKGKALLDKGGPEAPSPSA